MKENISVLLRIKAEIITVSAIGVSMVSATHVIQLLTAIICFSSAIYTLINKKKE